VMVQKGTVAILPFLALALQNGLHGVDNKYPLANPTPMSCAPSSRCVGGITNSAYVSSSPVTVHIVPVRCHHQSTRGMCGAHARIHHPHIASSRNRAWPRATKDECKYVWPVCKLRVKDAQEWLRTVHIYIYIYIHIYIYTYIYTLHIYILCEYADILCITYFILPPQRRSPSVGWEPAQLAGSLLSWGSLLTRRR
jgi:hypothetical protein